MYSIYTKWQQNMKNVALVNIGVSKTDSEVEKTADCFQAVPGWS